MQQIFKQLKVLLWLLIEVRAFSEMRVLRLAEEILLSRRSGLSYRYSPQPSLALGRTENQEVFTFQ
ncbi:hypothetical protein [Pseudoalteromonas pernae]|uniref:hypothetical protein n=1 Tax=Pseudoalteromonas pernae TaxID=3118054 RepID=UPI003242B1A1